MIDYREAEKVTGYHSRGRQEQMTSRDPHPCVTPPESNGKMLKEVSARGEIHSDAKFI